MKNEPIIDVRHQRIIKEARVNNSKKQVMTVGAGCCKIDYHLVKEGWDVYSTDYQHSEVFDKRMVEYFDVLNYNNSNIFDVGSFPIKKANTIICSEVLEHLENYQLAFKNLLKLTEKRLIITVPWKRSFDDTAPPPKGHCNYWDDEDNGMFKSIKNMTDLAKPHNIHIEKIITKEIDITWNQRCYLIIIDKK